MRRSRNELPQGTLDLLVLQVVSLGPLHVLAHICRRGRITGAQVGQIRVDARMASFEVEGGIAREFETRVQGRDARDPKLFIRRDGGRPARVFARS